MSVKGVSTGASSRGLRRTEGLFGLPHTAKLRREHPFTRIRTGCHQLQPATFMMYSLNLIESLAGTGPDQAVRAGSKGHRPRVLIRHPRAAPSPRLLRKRSAVGISWTPLHEVAPNLPARISVSSTTTAKGQMTGLFLDESHPLLHEAPQHHTILPCLWRILWALLTSEDDRTLPDQVVRVSSCSCLHPPLA